MKAKIVLDAINETIEDFERREGESILDKDMDAADQYGYMAEAMRWFADVMYDKTGF